MARALLFALIVILAPRGWAEDVPLERCDRLFVVHAASGPRKLLLLVDTGATSMLNIKSFAHDGDPVHIQVNSWNQTAETSAREVTLPELVIGEHRLRQVKLPAVDLTAIGSACGRKLDGILGTDLLEELGATLDVKNRVARLGAEGKNSQAELDDFYAQFEECGMAFVRADENTFAKCLDPGFVLFTMNGDYYGRDAVMDYFRKHYFLKTPLPRLSMTPRAYHAIGDAMWIEYDLGISMQGQNIEARGTALYRKTEGRWRILNMNHSARPAEIQCSPGASDATCKTTAKSY